MEIRIKRVTTERFKGNAFGLLNTYIVHENETEFIIARRTTAHGSSIALVGKEGTLYVDGDDRKVHRQVVALSGACGLNIDDEPVHGLPPLALRGVIFADENNETGEIVITGEELEDGTTISRVRVDGKFTDIML